MLLLALVIVANELRDLVARAAAGRAGVDTEELSDLDATWQRYQELSTPSLGIGISGLERALVRQTMTQRIG